MGSHAAHGMRIDRRGWGGKGLGRMFAGRTTALRTQYRRLIQMAMKSCFTPETA